MAIEREVAEFARAVAIGVCVSLVVRWITEDAKAQPPQSQRSTGTKPQAKLPR